MVMTQTASAEAITAFAVTPGAREHYCDGGTPTKRADRCRGVAIGMLRKRYMALKTARVAAVQISPLMSYIWLSRNAR